MNETIPVRSKWSDTALIAVFLAALVAPAAAMLARSGQASASVLGEDAVRWPSIGSTLKSAGHYPEAVRTYFNANFGLRRPLIRAVSLAKLRVFGVPASRKVIAGTDGWLYYAFEYEEDCLRHARPLTSDELAAWKTMLETRRDWLSAQGIAYVFTVAPDKHSIQPEHMPAWIRPARGPSRLDQFMEYMRANSTVRVLDLRPVVAKVLEERDAYLRCDTHWNELSAFAVYQELCKELQHDFPQLKTATLGEFDVETESSATGDLGLIAGLPDLYPQDAVHLVPKRPREARFLDTVPGSPQQFGIGELRTSECARGEIARAVIFHDSFGVTLHPFLAEHLAHAVFLWTWSFDRALVEREKPQVVVEQMVERALMLNVDSLADKPR